MTRSGIVAGLLLILGVPGVALADEGDPPSGPEACVVEEVNRRRGGADLIWSGSIQDELRRHASSMADRGDLDHASLNERVAGLPEGWSGYGEASYAQRLLRGDHAAVDAWCTDAVRSFWESPSHREVLADGSYRFVAAGSHWDGERMWVVVGVFSHPDLSPAPVAWPDTLSQGLVGAWEGTFVDDDHSVFESDIEALVRAGITRGCDPSTGIRFCPEATVTRGEMAAFLARAFDWDSPGVDSFSDDDGSPFERDIEALSARDVTEGCNPPVGDRYCPRQPVTRGEMATFLARALGLESRTDGTFVDTADSVHRTDIEALFGAGITTGCDRDGRRFCPDLPLTRGQMAAFLVRAGLAG